MQINSLALSFLIYKGSAAGFVERHRLAAKMSYLLGCYQMLMVLILLLQICPLYGNWLGFFASSESEKEGPSEEHLSFPRDNVADFSIELFTNERGMKMLEDARSQLAVAPPNSCWQKAYNSLLSGCAKTLADEESRNRFSWDLTDCFLQHSGRNKLPYCDRKSPVSKCLKTVDQQAVNVYLEYYLETNNICYQLQINAFKEQTERLVNELRRAAEYADSKLQNIEEQGEKLLQNSEKIGDSLTSLEKQSRKVAGISKDVQTRLSDLFDHTKVIYKQFMGISASQMELIKGQNKMKESLEEGMSVVHESYNNLGKGIDNLKNETVKIEKEINEVGGELSSKINNLQSKADDIGNMAETSLDKQKEILDGQSEALEGLQVLTKFQSEALEKSRETAEHMAEFNHRQQEENLRLQEKLQGAHDSIIEKTKTILAAQEAFEAKQSSIFATVDKILSVLNTIQLESRVLKAIFLYLFFIILLQIFTSTKQISDVRPRIHLHFVIAFCTDCFIFWWIADDIYRYGWLITLNRSIFGIGSICRIIYGYFTYCDYAKEDHERLKRLEESKNEERKERLLLQEEYEDSEVNWSRWVDTDLPDDIGKLEDPDYIYQEEVGENSIQTPVSSHRYYLRRRH